MCTKIVRSPSSPFLRTPFKKCARAKLRKFGQRVVRRWASPRALGRVLNGGEPCSAMERLARDPRRRCHGWPVALQAVLRAFAPFMVASSPSQGAIRRTAIELMRVQGP